MPKNDFNKFWVIAKKVYKKNVKSMGFILTLIAPIFMAIVPFAIGYFSQTTGEATPAEFAVISEDETVRTLFEDDNLPWNFVNDIESESEAREAVRQESLDAYMIIGVGEAVNADLTQIDDKMATNLSIIEEMLTSYQMGLRGAEANLTTQEISQMLESATLSTESIRIEEGAIVEGNVSEQVIQSLFVTLVGFGLFMLLMMYSNSIVQEIASEKGTRIMEVILSTTSSHIHFGGKLAGILMVLGTQFIVYIALFAFGLPYIENVPIIEELFGGIQVTEIIQPTYWYVIVFFTIGLFIYIILAAFLGSLANKVEDAAKMLAPIQTISVIGFYGALFMVSGADNTLINVLSYIPFFTPFIMPMRIVHNQVGMMGMTIGIIGSLTFTVALFALSLFFYRTNVLVYSDSNVISSLKQSWSLMKSNRSSKKVMQVNETK